MFQRVGSSERRAFDDFIEITKDHQAFFQVAPFGVSTNRQKLVVALRFRRRAGSRGFVYINNTETQRPSSCPRSAKKDLKTLREGAETGDVITGICCRRYSDHSSGGPVKVKW